MKLKFLFIICVVAAICACDDGIPDTVELKDFMYLSLTGASDDPTVIELDYHIRDTVFITGGISYGGTTNYHQGNMEATIEADFTLVNSFNTAHGTDYLPLPANAYSLSSNKATIADGKNASDALKLTVRNSNMNLSKRYLFPLTVTSVSGGNLPLNDRLKTLYLAFTFEEIVTTPDRSKWKSGGASTIQPGYAVEDMFDGDINTMWHTTYPVDLPQWFIVDMTELNQFSGFTLRNRQNYVVHWPKHIKFEVRDNKTDWQTVLDIAELPQTRDEQTLPLEAPVVARYFRVTVLSIWGDDGTPAVDLSEIGIY